MSGTGLRLAQAAESFAGVPFRLCGRDPALGLDCVGLVLAALAASGRTVADLPPYRLREQSIARFLPLLPANGFVPATGPVRAGDLLLARPGPAQHHLLLCGQRNNAVHAHAGLGRVCLAPLPLPWPVEQFWRLS